MSKDEDAVAKVIAESITSIDRNDVEGWLKPLADDIVYLPPDHPAVVGKSAVRSWAKNDYFDKFKLRFEYKLNEVQVAGSMAIVRGDMTMGLTPKQGGGEMVLAGKFLDVLKRNMAGQWKVTHVAFNGNAPAAGGR